MGQTTNLRYIRLRRDTPTCLVCTGKFVDNVNCGCVHAVQKREIMNVT